MVIAAKTVKAHPKLPGTIFTAAEEIRKAGGKALAVQTDIRFEEQVQAAIDAAVKEFGGLDIVINNASAINLTPTTMTKMKTYDLMNTINARGTFMTSKLAIPHLLKSKNPHILNLSPPLNMEERWFAPHVAYTMAKFGMSMCVLGMSGELRDDGIAVNAIWPRTTIATAAVNNLLGGSEMMNTSRTVEIMADSAYKILTRKSTECTGNFFVDEEVLRSFGQTDFSMYPVVKGTKDEDLTPDFFC